jgi:hypothetical protein
MAAFASMGELDVLVANAGVGIAGLAAASQIAKNTAREVEASERG